MDKKALNEREICSKYISPPVERAGWNPMAQIREEVRFTKGQPGRRGLDWRDLMEVLWTTT